jgi:hypothetical protein
MLLALGIAGSACGDNLPPEPGGQTSSEVAALAIGEPMGAVTEAGGTAAFTVRLARQPIADVRVAVSASDPSEAAVSTSTNELVFTTRSWNKPQT